MAGDHRDDPAVAEIDQPPHERREGTVLAMMPGDLRAQLRGRPGAELDLWHTAHGVFGEEEPAQLQYPRRLDDGTGVPLVQIVLLRGQRELALPAGRLEGGLELRPEIAPLPLELERVVEDPEGAFRKVVGHRLEPARKEARKDGGETRREQRIVLRPGLDLVDELPQLPGGRLDGVGGCADGGDGGLAARIVEDDLAGRAERDFGELRDGALRLGIEAPQALHLVAEELDAHRGGVERRPDVEHAAPDREGPGVLDDRDLRVARRGQLARELVAILRRRGGELEATLIERLAGKDPPREAPHGRDD